MNGSQPHRYRHYLFFLLAALVYLYPFLHLAPGVNDEGEFLYDAVRVTQGQVPSRDFFEVMSPGTFYWLALFFKIFGTTWMASRILLLVTSLSTGALLYYLARRLHIPFPAAPAILLVATSYGLLWPAISHHADSTLFALLAFAVFVRALDGRSAGVMLLTGAIAGLTTCFIQQKGLLLFLSFVAVLWLLCRNQPRFWTFLGCLAAGYAAVGLCVAGLFYRAGALGSLVYANVIFPLTRYGSANSVPYGMGVLGFYWHRWTVALNQAMSPMVAYPAAAALIVPFLFIGALPVVLAAFALLQRKQALNPLTTPYWVCGVAIWLSELQRKDIWHLVYGSPLLLVLCFYLVHRAQNKWSWRAVQLVTACACLLAVCNILVAATARTPIFTRRGTVYGYQPDPVLEYLNAHIQPGEEIFAYPFRPMYYFLLDARNPTKYTFYLRGMLTDAMFRSAVDALEAGKVKHVIWDTTFEDPDEAWAFQNAIATPIIEPYLMQHYNIVYARNNVRVLERKN